MWWITTKTFGMAVPFHSFGLQSTFAMDQNQAYQKDIASIRQLMERSVKFLSLSGLSGVLAGCYALAGAAVAYFLVQYPRSLFSMRTESLQQEGVMSLLMLVALVVLAASLITGYVLARKKAKKNGTEVWNSTSKRLIVNLAIPLVSGGIFILILLQYGHYGIAAPASLLFYGLALMNASQLLFDEVRYLGYSEIILGLVALWFQGYGLLFWALGFGVLHIIYGAVMYRKYDS